MRDDTLVYLTLGVVLAILIYYGGSTLMTSGNDVLNKFAEAIKQFEGWFEGSASQRNNNPGNLKDRGQTGVIGRDQQGHAIFNTYQAGYDALLNQLRLIVYGGSSIYNPGMSFYDVFSKYAEGNSRQYAEFVAAQLGVSPETRMNQLV